MEGTLEKLGYVHKAWQSRFFRLESCGEAGGALVYFVEKGMPNEQGRIVLSDICHIRKLVGETQVPVVPKNAPKDTNGKSTNPPGKAAKPPKPFKLYGFELELKSKRRVIQLRKVKSSHLLCRSDLYHRSKSKFERNRWVNTLSRKTGVEVTKPVARVIRRRVDAAVKSAMAGERIDNVVNDEDALNAIGEIVVANTESKVVTRIASSSRLQKLGGKAASKALQNDKVQAKIQNEVHGALERPAHRDPSAKKAVIPKGTVSTITKVALKKKSSSPRLSPKEGARSRGSRRGRESATDNNTTGKSRK